MSSEPCLTVALFNKPNPQQPLSRYNFFASMYESHLHIMYWLEQSGESPRQFHNFFGRCSFRWLLSSSPLSLLDLSVCWAIHQCCTLTHSCTVVLAHSHCPAHLRHCLHTSGTPAPAASQLFPFSTVANAKINVAESCVQLRLRFYKKKCFA